MSLLDSLGGLLAAQQAQGRPAEPAQAGDQVAGALGSLLGSQGGITGLLEQFAANGLGHVAQSWVQPGQPNQPVSADQVTQVMGSGPIGAFAQKLGLPPDQAAQIAAQVLPHLVDHLTPGGQVTPDNGTGPSLEGALGGVLGSLLGGRA